MSDFSMKSKLNKPGTQALSNKSRLDFDKIIEISKGADYKKTEFIIPKNIGRKVSEDSNTLKKYLKDNSNVQSHTIHISELLNSGSKESLGSSLQKSPPISNISSINRLKGHKRVKSHHLINSLSTQKTPFDRHLIKGKAIFRIEDKHTPKASIGNLTDITEKSVPKKQNPYMMKKSSKKAFSKKNSIPSTKYTVLKSKKHTQSYLPHTKHKSVNVTPKKKNKKLYDYQYSVQNVPQMDNKSKITMNVSIDLSQNKKQNIIFIDKNYIPTTSNKNVKRSHQASPIIEEDAELDLTSSKVKSLSKKSSTLTKNSKPTNRAKVEEYKPKEASKEKKFLGDKKQSHEATAPLYSLIDHKAQSNSLLNQYNKVSEKVEAKKSARLNNSKPINVLKNEPINSERYKKLKEEQKYFDTHEDSSIEGEIQKLPELSIDRKSPAEGCVPSIPISERCDTFETDISALNLSPKSKAVMKLKKLIKMTFKRTGQPPDSTAEFYRIGKILGRGAFGKVSLTIHRLTDAMVAIKSLNKEFLTDETSRLKVMKEVKILKKMRHQNIVQLYDTFETEKHIIFVMELCSGGDLLNYVRKRRKLSEDYAKVIYKQILEALHYCHKLNILHRDIKLDNIILNSEGIIKVGDFGVSKIVDPKQTMYDQCGTPAYIAPEILKDKGYTGFGIDVWSSGVVLYAMLYGTVPFRAQSMGDLHDMIVKAKYSLKSDISEPARDLIKKVLEPDPRKRLTIPEILKHAWFDDLKSDLEMFTEQEKEKIKQEFSYNDVKQNQINDTDIS